MSGYAIVNADDVEDHYAGSDVPGEFRRLTDALGAEQLSATLIRVPPHSDFEQGTGHFHDEVEELYLVTRGTLTMRFGDDVQKVAARLGGPRRAADAALAPQRGRRARRAVGDLAQDRPRRRDEDRRVLGGVARRRAAALARAQRCSGFAAAAWQPASHSERWLPYAGMPPASLSIRARCMRFHAMNDVLRLVKSFSGPPEPGSR